MGATDDLTSLLVPPPPNAGLRFGQGTITAWNPDTFENKVLWRGVTLTNVPILSTVEALTYAPGDVVGLLGWAPGGGAGSWWITGRIITPGPGAAAKAIQFFQTTLAREISSEIFADRIKSDVIAANESTTSEAFTDLATVGPQVTVEISEVGLAIVMLSARIGNNVAGGDPDIRGFMDFEVTGATSRAAVFDTSLGLIVVADASTTGHAIRAGVQSPVTVNPGTNTFTAKYRREGGAPDPAYFDDRRMIVIGF